MHFFREEMGEDGIRCIAMGSSLQPRACTPIYDQYSCGCVVWCANFREIAGWKNPKWRYRFSTKSSEDRDFRGLDAELGGINHTLGSDGESKRAWRKSKNNVCLAIFSTRAS